jgi:DNA-binding response OmpR family regulator
MATALIVEDHPDQADLAAKMLRFHRYEPVIAADGTTGLELARRLAPDVVLLDLMLRDISGFDVCRKLRTDRATMLTPVVMLTALNDAVNRLLGFRVGANAYVTKPYGVDQLLKAIADARAWRDEMARANLQGEIHVELNSEITLLQDLNDFLLLLCQSTPFSNEEALQLRWAVMEMAQNAIGWGNEHRSDRLVTIRYRIFPNRIEIVFRDQGEGFDENDPVRSAARVDPFTRLGLRDKLGLRTGGLEQLLAKSPLFEFKHDNAGHELILTKWFPVDSRA